MEPQIPTLRAQINYTNLRNQIRPVIKSMNAPSYKIAKHIINKLNGYLGLSNHYNAENSINLAEDITKLKINENHKVII
jgi:regulator of PEP synthase PpsR (kinase-PPPase family)